MIMRMGMTGKNVGAWLTAALVILCSLVPGAGAVDEAESDLKNKALLENARKKLAEEKQAKLEAFAKEKRLPKRIQDTLVYEGKSGSWDEKRCSDELAKLVERRMAVENELLSIPKEQHRVRLEAYEKNPEIKALRKDILDKQALLAKKIAELEALTDLSARKKILRNELIEIETKRQVLQYRVMKMGGKLPQSLSTKKAGASSDSAKDEGKENLQVVR